MLKSIDHPRVSLKRLNPKPLTIEEFLVECQKRGFHFTYNWVRKRLREMGVTLEG